MKVHIGDYVPWYGPYQIAKLILFWKDEEKDESVHQFGKWLATDKNGNESVFAEVCEWLHSKKKRKIKVRIDDYDLFSMDSTLCYIIHPMLIKLKEAKAGTPAVDKADVPEELHSTYGTLGDFTDTFSEEAWSWVLDEMTWSFDPDWEEKYGFGASGHDFDKYQENNKRMENGHRLFGCYLSSMWT